MSPSQKRTTAVIFGVVVVVILALMQWNTEISLTEPLGHGMPASTTESLTTPEGETTSSKPGESGPE
jgi:hypothetical protein